jgi:Peptidase family M28
MQDKAAWSRIEEEAAGAFLGQGRFPVAAYSEFMPPPYVGIKPFTASDPVRALAATTVCDEGGLAIDEYQQEHELRPGLAKIASHLSGELRKLASGAAHEFSRTLLDGNLAWPAALAAAAREGCYPQRPFFVMQALALSRTQDDKGNVRWTLFGASHQPASAVFWRGFSETDEQRFLSLITWASGDEPPPSQGLRVLGPAADLPGFARTRLWREHEPAKIHTLFTLEPFGSLPDSLQTAYLAGTLRILPTPASHVFSWHPGYRKLAAALPRATQIPLLHLFPRVQEGYTIRIPQSGWLDEHDPSQARPAGSHRVVHHIARTHRWQRTPRDQALVGDGAFTDTVTVALFSTNPDDLGLYGKPMARNSQIWTHDYERLLDGPSANKPELERAAELLDRGGRFGYRIYYPPMRAGTRELFWHLPLLARLQPGRDQAEIYEDTLRLGTVTAEATAPAGGHPLVLAANLLDRPGHHQAASLFVREPGQLRHTTAQNLRKLLDFREYLASPLPGSFARALLRIAKETTLDSWLAKLPHLANDPEAATRLVDDLRAHIGSEIPLGSALTLGQTGTRAFEEALWRTISALAEGEYRHKETADGVVINQGRTGGPAARAARVVAGARGDLDRLGQHLHDRYREIIERHDMRGRAQVFDHTFIWRTDFDLSWSEAWANNQNGQEHERNIVVVIPGRNRGQAVLMADHYDTAYMEDVYEPARGGDGLRAAAAGADDNHSATATLLAAAEVFLPLARAGRLERDIWLVHLTGEEFPSDCLGARALGQALVERSLCLTAEDGSPWDASAVRVVGAFILDMIGHNNNHDRDVFQIASGEGAGSARLALCAHLANQRWNQQAQQANAGPARRGLGRALRMADGKEVPPPFAHLPVAGEVRVEWEPRSSLYNTDGQIFSDLGMPVVLFMENYDINRTGYHDTDDSMNNIDLDYASAVAAIAIESVAAVACGDLGSPCTQVPPAPHLR